MTLASDVELVRSTASRRLLLERAALTAGLGLITSGGLLLPRSAEACHEVPKSKGGCMKESSSSSGSKSSSSSSSGSKSSSSSPSSSSGSASWSGQISSGDVGRSPQSFFATSNKSWAITKKFSTTRGSPRTTIGRAPDGRPSIQMNIPSGPNFNNQFWNAPFGSRGVDAAVLSVDVYLQSGFDWAKSEGKLAFGLWGGDGSSDVSGGVSPSKQKGFSVRNVRGNDKAGWGLRLYSYHLNRNSGKWGQVSSQRSSPIAKGRWVNMQLEVKMNSVGSNNGYAKLRVDGKQVAEMNSLQWRRNNDVAIRGMFWNDMWGGNEQDRVNWSPKSQKMWYSNYKLYKI